MARLGRVEMYWTYEASTVGENVLDVYRKRWNGHLPPYVWRYVDPPLHTPLKLTPHRSFITCIHCTDNTCYHVSTLPPTPNGIPLRCANCIALDKECVFSITFRTMDGEDIEERVLRRIHARYLPDQTCTSLTPDHFNLDMVWFEGIPEASTCKTVTSPLRSPAARRVVAIGGIRIDVLGAGISGRESLNPPGVMSFSKRPREEGSGEDLEYLSKRAKAADSEVSLIRSDDTNHLLDVSFTPRRLSRHAQCTSYLFSTSHHRLGPNLRL